MVTNRSRKLAEEMAAVNDRIFKEWQSKRTCKNCKYWRVFDDGTTASIQCMHKDIIVLAPPETFGCNQWEAEE